eukprot:PITA_14808
MADAGTGLTNSQLPQFNGKNHNDWSIKMKALFASQGIWELVETGYAEPADATALAALTAAERDQLKGAKKKDAKALFLLFQSVHESIFPRIAAATKSKEAWDTLKIAYQGMEKVKTAKLQMLRRDFETLSMKESDTIDSFFTQVIGLITQIRSHGEILEERRIVEKILRCLPSRFEAVVVAIEETKDLSQFTVDELNASLMSHEDRLSRGTDSSFEQAFKTQMSFSQRKGRGRANNRGRGRSQNRGRYYPASTSGRSCSQNQYEGSSKQQAHGQRYDKSQVQCHYCKKYGHYANECRKKQNDMNSRQNVNFANEENKNSKNVLLTCNIAQDKQQDVWFLDSGCSNHMTGNIAMFANLDEDVKSEVTTGTDSKIAVKGKGRVSIRARNGEQMIVPDVYYVPGLKCNLLSIGQLIDKGYNVFFKDDTCTIRDIPPSKKIIAQVQMTSNRMFPLKLRVDLKEGRTIAAEGRTIAAVTQEVFQEQVKDENWLWHLRFGHLNFGGLNLLHKKGMVRGLPLIEKPDSLCEGCILGKQHKESFPAGKSIRAKAPLEIVHSDVCGPMQVPSLGGNRYVLTFIDDYTRKTWVYMLKQKSEVFENSATSKLLLRNSVGITSKCSEQTEEENTSPKTFCVFAERTTYRNSSQQGIHLSKTVLLKERKGPFLTWLEVC